MDEHDVEGALEPERPHVALEVLALGVERSAQREHLRREIREGAREPRLEVRRVVAASRPELEQCPRLAVTDVVDDSRDERRFVRSSRTDA